MSQPKYRKTGDFSSRQWLGIGLLFALGLLLRLWFLAHFFEVSGDSLIYGGIAKNLLLHGRYALNGSGGELYPTLIRLPGYPCYLAACFALFGMENYGAAAVVSILLELAGCLLLADTVRRIAPHRIARPAAWITLGLSLLCPFTAIFAASPLTEAPSLFALTVALNLAIRFATTPGWCAALGFSLAVSAAALLRPDGALVGVALLPVMLLALRRLPLDRALCMASSCMILALLPFMLWTARNWQSFQVIEPLAPRLAMDPGEDPHLGWEAWTKSWCLDFVSTYQVYWNVPDGELDATVLPERAFDSEAQRQKTLALIDDYNTGGQKLTHEIDARFGALARERAAAHPWRTHLWLPLGRVADMLVRPRIENLPIDLDWWVYRHHHTETIFSWVYVALNALYLLTGLAGLLLLRPRFWWAMALFFVLRCALLATVEAPEARYTLEFFPIFFITGGLLIAWMGTRAGRVKAGGVSGDSGVGRVSDVSGVGGVSKAGFCS